MVIILRKFQHWLASWGIVLIIIALIVGLLVPSFYIADLVVMLILFILMSADSIQYADYPRLSLYGLSALIILIALIFEIR